MPKPNKQIIIDAIVKEIEKGKSFDTCLKLSGTKWNLTRSTFIRRWKTANEQHTAKQQAIKKELAAIDTQAAIDARKKGLKSKLERLMFYQDEIEVMEKQLRGEVKFPFALGNSIKNSHTGDLFMLPVQIQNQIREQIAAFQDKISKIEGDYAETAFRIRGDKENPLLTRNTIDDTQFQQLLTAARESKTTSGK